MNRSHEIQPAQHGTILQLSWLWLSKTINGDWEHDSLALTIACNYYIIILVQSLKLWTERVQQKHTRAFQR